ncbi:hypothetical protein JCM10450v2_006558 [Rhodotorula kratochvilovae]
MSARARLPRNIPSSTLSYADPHTSSSDTDSGEDASGSGAARGRKGRGPSKRTKGKAKAVEGDDDEESDEDEAPRKKARKGRTGATKGRKKGEGRLEVLKTLPVELLLGIFSHVDINDLLALSMVNKQHRALLTAKASGRLWRDARDRLDLPKMSSCGFKGWQYAHLMFGKHCFVCNAASGTTTYASLRTRLCKRCSAELLVDISRLDRTHPDLSVHPLAHKCVRRTSRANYGGYYGENPQYALLDELLEYSAILYNLAADASETDADDQRPESPPRQPTSSNAPSRPRRHKRLNRVTYYGLDVDGDGEDVSETRKVSEFVAARVQTLAPLYKDAGAFHHACWKMQQHSREVRAQAAQDHRAQEWDAHSEEYFNSEKKDQRAAAIEKRVLELDMGFAEDDFCGAWTTDKLVNNTAALDDEEWTRTKPRVLKLLGRVRQKRLADERINRQQARQISLRHRYDKLKQSLPRKARPFVPLFVDFLLLPSVKELWEPEDAVLNRATWTAQLDAITEELEQHRLELVEHAHELVIRATTDPDERDDADEDDERDLSDAFFARATSFVCCGVKGCFAKQNCSYVKMSTGWTCTPHPNEDRKGAIGPLIKVLQHQHEKHNDEDHITQPKLFAGEPRFRIELPLEIACAMSAVLDLLKLDPLTAGLKALERAEADVWHYEWDNSPAYKRKCHGRDPWFYLLCFIKYEGDKRAAMNPPLPLDPPCIILRTLT